MSLPDSFAVAAIDVAADADVDAAAGDGLGAVVERFETDFALLDWAMSAATTAETERKTNYRRGCKKV